VSQQAWVQQGTLRDNICFGRAYEERRFSKVVYACALEKDLEQLPGRDMTELGGKVPKTLFSARQHICYSALYAIARPSVCQSVCPGISQRRLKLGSRNLHHRVAP